jgi:ABC-2 type transport system ATP-binding protein
MSYTDESVAGIAAFDLAKAFGDRTALDGVSLDVHPATVLGLLGPNGAGKTTLVRILATLLTPDRGRAMVAGHDVAAEPGVVRRRIGLTGQFTAVDALLTGFENLEMLGRLLRLGPRQARQRADELLARFDLSAAAQQRVGTYSGGMRRRLDLAASLVVPPSVLFLDEPTTGLDPRSRMAVWDAVRELAAQGTTVLLTTQYLEEADRLADRIALLDGGRIVASGTPAELKSRVGGARLDLTVADVAAFERASRHLNGRVVHADIEGLTLRVGTDGTGRAVHALLEELEAAYIGVDRLSVTAPSLDDVFFAVTGHAARAQEISAHD